MDAVMNMMYDPVHAVNYGMKKAGILIRFDGAGIRDAAQAEDSGNEECNGGFHISLSLFYPKYRRADRNRMQGGGCAGARIRDEGCRAGYAIALHPSRFSSTWLGRRLRHFAQSAAHP
jgi:hypothetical protein